jgi:transcriptional regulator with XRE-family HTH domain
MNTLLQQLKKRRLDLGLKQHDMMLRVGVSRQQYQRLESKLSIGKTYIRISNYRFFAAAHSIALVDRQQDE